MRGERRKLIAVVMAVVFVVCAVFLTPTSNKVVKGATNDTYNGNGWFEAKYATDNSQTSATYTGTTGNDDGLWKYFSKYSYNQHDNKSIWEYTNADKYGETSAGAKDGFAAKLSYGQYGYTFYTGNLKSLYNLSAGTAYTAYITLYMTNQETASANKYNLTCSANGSSTTFSETKTIDAKMTDAEVTFTGTITPGSGDLTLTFASANASYAGYFKVKSFLFLGPGETTPAGSTAAPTTTEEPGTHDTYDGSEWFNATPQADNSQSSATATGTKGNDDGKWLYFSKYSYNQFENKSIVKYKNAGRYGESSSGAGDGFTAKLTYGDYGYTFYTGNLKSDFNLTAGTTYTMYVTLSMTNEEVTPANEYTLKCSTVGASTDIEDTKTITAGMSDTDVTYTGSVTPGSGALSLKFAASDRSFAGYFKVKSIIFLGPGETTTAAPTQAPTTTDATNWVDLTYNADPAYSITDGTKLFFGYDAGSTISGSDYAWQYDSDSTASYNDLRAKIKRNNQGSDLETAANDWSMNISVPNTEVFTAANNGGTALVNGHTYTMSISYKVTQQGYVKIGIGGDGYDSPGVVEASNTGSTANVVTQNIVYDEDNTTSSNAVAFSLCGLPAGTIISDITFSFTDITPTTTQGDWIDLTYNADPVFTITDGTKLFFGYDAGSTIQGSDYAWQYRSGQTASYSVLQGKIKRNNQGSDLENAANDWSMSISVPNTQVFTAANNGGTALVDGKTYTMSISYKVTQQGYVKIGIDGGYEAPGVVHATNTGSTPNVVQQEIVYNDAATTSSNTVAFSLCGLPADTVISDISFSFEEVIPTTTPEPTTTDDGWIDVPDATATTVGAWTLFANYAEWAQLQYKNSTTTPTDIGDTSIKVKNPTGWYNWNCTATLIDYCRDHTNMEYGKPYKITITLNSSMATPAGHTIKVAVDNVSYLFELTAGSNELVIEDFTYMGEYEHSNIVFDLSLLAKGTELNISDITVEDDPDESTSAPAPTTAPPVVDPNIALTGYQINTSYEGFRMVGQIEMDKLGSEVTEYGFVYGLSKIYKPATGTYQDTGITDEGMVVDSSNKYVVNYPSTSEGTISQPMGHSTTARYFARTMTFGKKNKAAYTSVYKVRVYAKLANNEVVYSDVNDFTVYQIARALYDGCLMNSFDSHEYLYNTIISKVDTEPATVPFEFGHKIAVPGEKNS